MRPKFWNLIPLHLHRILIADHNLLKTNRRHKIEQNWDKLSKGLKC
jgi:hypothetical protein